MEIEKKCVPETTCRLRSRPAASELSRSVFRTSISSGTALKTLKGRTHTAEVLSVGGD